MPPWAFFPGLVLIGVSIALTVGAVFGAMITRRRNAWMTLLGVRLRFIGMGVLFIIPGVVGMISGLLTWFNPGLFGVGLFMAVMGGVYFYAASNPILGRAASPSPGQDPRRGTNQKETTTAHRANLEIDVRQNATGSPCRL
jgi:hypothetical protein